MNPSSKSLPNPVPSERHSIPNSIVMHLFRWSKGNLRLIALVRSHESIISRLKSRRRAKVPIVLIDAAGRELRQFATVDAEASIFPRRGDRHHTHSSRQLRRVEPEDTYVGEDAACIRQ
jgi:hypothetical protein